MSLTGRKGWIALARSMSFASSALAAENPLGAGAAGREAVVSEPEGWGTATDSVIVVGAGDVVPPSDTVTWSTLPSAGTGIGVFQTSATQVDWWYLMHIPSGALLQRVSFEACDTSTTAGMQFGLATGAVPGGVAANTSAAGSTGVAATPGCALFSVTPTATTAVNNGNTNYWLFFDWTGTGFGSTVRLNSIRIFYRLQVSPAPATATFPNDVPTTHPFFRFVEALAASGVTGGCGTGSFCPDAAVTRGQLAVFLATSLGMHFAP